METALLVIIGAIVVLGINTFAAFRMQKIAEDKGSTERFWAWCFWLGFIGYAMVIALPDYRSQKALEKLANQSNGSNSTEDISDALPEL